MYARISLECANCTGESRIYGCLAIGDHITFRVASRQLTAPIGWPLRPAKPPVVTDGTRGMRQFLSGVERSQRRLGCPFAAMRY